MVSECRPFVHDADSRAVRKVGRASSGPSPAPRPTSAASQAEANKELEKYLEKPGPEVWMQGITPPEGRGHLPGARVTRFHM